MEQKKCIGRKLLSFLLTLALVLGLLPGMGMTAYAATYSESSINVNADGSVTATFTVTDTNYINNGMKGWLLSLMTSEPSLVAGKNNIIAYDKHPYGYENCAHYFFISSEVKSGQITVTWPASANDQKENWSADGEGVSTKKLSDYSRGTWYFAVGPRYVRTDWSGSEVGAGKDGFWENCEYYIGSKAVDTQTITASDVTATYGDTDKSVSATTDGNGAISYAVKSGSENYIDVNASTGALTIKKVPADGKAYVTVTAAETATYAQATKEVTVTINKANAVAATVTANNRTYDGTEKPLVTVTGEATGGTMQYALGTATEATEQYTTPIPAETNAGTYYVWYKVVGDDSHKDTEAQNLPVTIKNAIQHTVTFKVVNGKWNDGINADKIVTLKGAEGDTLKLTADQIPEVGNEPSSSYEAGSWDVTPSNETAITQDTIYTYTYGLKVTSKLEQVIEAGDVTATLGDTDKKVTASVTTPEAGGGAISYAVKDGSGDYIDVDASSGALTIKAVPADGKAFVTVKAAETDDYAETTKEVTVTISQPSVTPKVELNNSTLSLTVNEESTLTATTVPADQPVTWSSTSPDVATVDSTGKVTAKSAGTTKVVATITVDGRDYPAECDVTVAAAPTPEPTPTPDTPSVVIDIDTLNVAVNEEQQIDVTVVPAGTPVTWTSSEPTIVSVDSTGEVKGLLPGRSTITATITVGSDTYSDEFTVIVSDEPVSEGVTITPRSLNLQVGGGRQLGVETIPVGAPVRFASGNEAVATVDDDGIVTAVAPGIAVISATISVGDTVYAATCFVTVTAEPVVEDTIDRHAHVYEWDTINATADQDGEMRYQCRICGDIQTRVPITAYYIFNKETTEKIRRAKQGETVKIETARWISFHKMVMEALAERPDVTLEVSFLDEGHKGARKSFTIPAGTDTKSLVDDKGFAGFIYLTNKFDNTVTTP